MVFVSLPLPDIPALPLSFTERPAGGVVVSQYKCGLDAVDHYSLLRYAPSFEFPLKQNRSQFSPFLSRIEKGGIGFPNQAELETHITRVIFFFFLKGC